METMTQSHPGTDAADRDAVPDGKSSCWRSLFVPFELARGKDVWGHHEMTKATPFQLSLLEDLKPGVDYSTYADDVASAVHFPRWFYRQQKQPEVTLRSMASKGLLHRRIVRAGEYFKIPVYRLPTSEPA